MSTDTISLKMISFITITKLVCTSSGNYIPALTFRFETLISTVKRDRTIWNWYTFSFYQMMRYYYLNSTAQHIPLFLC